MLCQQKDLGLEANNHQHLVSNFWIRDFKVKILLIVGKKLQKNFRLKVIICIHLSTHPTLPFTFVINAKKTRAEEIIQLH